MTTSNVRTHYRSCNLCEAICGIEIRLRGDEIISIRGDKKDPFSKGHICPKAVALQDLQNDPDRLRKPVKKTPQGWQEISWSEAFRETAKKLRGIQAEFGRDSVGVYQGNPTVHNLDAMIFGVSFFRQLKTKNRYSATSVDQLPHHLAAILMFGHALRLPIPDIDRTDYMLIMGANPVVSNGSIMTAPNVKKRLKAIQSRGGQFITIDPRFTETSKIADRHLFIRPGTDALLLLAMVNYLFSNGLVDCGHLHEYVEQLEQIPALVKDYSPESVAEETGIPALDIKLLVKEFCAAEKAVLYARIGVSTHEFGSLVNWLVNLFNILTGNLDTKGGAMFTTPAIDLIGDKKPAGKKHARYHSRVSQYPETISEFPVAALAEEILTPGKGQIKAMIVAAGNPLLSTPNNTQLEKAFNSLEFVLSIDFYINETSRHADIILPPPSPLERSHYDLAFNHFAVRNYARYSHALFEKAKGSLSEAEIYLELAYLMAPGGFTEKAKAWAKLKFLKTFKAEGFLAKGIKKGPYAQPKSQNNRDLSFKQLAKLEHGIDLGPLQSRFPEGILTKNGKIQLAPKKFVADLARLQLKFPTEITDSLAAAKPREKHSFLLIGRRDPRTCNSWLHNSYRMVKGKNRCTALIHPADADSIGIVQGQAVKVTSRAGSLELEVAISNEIMPGVISIPHGWGHGKANTRLDIANQHAGVSANQLTDEKLVDVLSGNAVLNGVPVEVTRI
ncbi:MAG: molybdopterin oxidoreductase family protein [Xanthomonadales bacterium]|nr:molybdopterin oxidoreductase family protein [Xanthomonadales bacterium]